MTSHFDREQLVALAASEFPGTFCLRGFPGDLFRVDLRSSYVNGAGTVVLYLDVWSRAGWGNFTKCVAPELRDQVVRPQVREVAEFLHRKFPGCWVLTDQLATRVLDLKPDDAQHPHGGTWWRTHHLLRYLGGLA